jgi:hypothetical protein
LQLQQQLQQQEQQQQQRQVETKIDVKMSTALSAIYKNSNQDRYHRKTRHSSHLTTLANKKMGCHDFDLLVLFTNIAMKINAMQRNH